MSPSDRQRPFGRTPDERVFRPGAARPGAARPEVARPGVAMPPDVRTRAAPLRPGALRFEHEVRGQWKVLEKMLDPPPAPAPGLAFEPEEGGPGRHVASGPAELPAFSGSTGPVPTPVRPGGEGPTPRGGATQETLRPLLDLAAERPPSGAGELGEATPAGAPPGPATRPVELGEGVSSGAAAAQVSAGLEGRVPASGDIEEELFGGRWGGGRERPGTDAAATAETSELAVPGAAHEGQVPSNGSHRSWSPGPGAAATPGPSGSARTGAGRDAARDGPEEKGGNWISVFVSEKVLGRRRRRASSRYMRRSSIFHAVAEGALGRAYRRTKRRLRAVDRFMRRLRMPLTNVLCGAVVALLAAALGVGAAWAGGVFAVAIVLTISGQPARNLLGFAGIIIAAAAFAEIVRQRARFFEILMSFFG